MLNLPINYIGIAIASIVSFIFGWLWYGPIFGKQWAKSNKVKMGKFEPQKLFYHFCTTVILVFVFSLIVTGQFSEMILMAALIYLGFFLSQRLASMIWMQQSWPLFFIDAGYHLVNIIIITLILNLTTIDNMIKSTI